MTEMRKRFIRESCLQLVAMCVCIFMSGQVSAATYYVNGGVGNDSNSGLTANAAWKTISKAATTLAAGDTVIVSAGTYQERVMITRSGASGRPIVYQASGKVVTRGFTIRANYITVSAFEITNTPDQWDNGCGVYLQGQYCKVVGNYLHDVTRVGIKVASSNPDDPLVSNNLVQSNRIIRAGLAGIEVYGRNNIIEGNDISHTLQYPPTWINTISGMDADGMRFFGSGHIIRKNYIHDILMSDPGNVNPHIDCFQTWGPANDITVEQNLCINRADGMQGFMIRGISSSNPIRNLVIRNNVIDTFRIVNLFDGTGFIFVNNLCIGNLSYSGSSGYGVELHNCINSTVQNNIFYNVGSHNYSYLYYDTAQGLQVGYNLVYMSDGRAPKTSSYVPRSTDLWQVDPMLGNIYDLNILPNSPLIDHGIAVQNLVNDYYGNPRPNGGGFDIGPYEYYLPTPQNLKAQ